MAQERQKLNLRKEAPRFDFHALWRPIHMNNSNVAFSVNSSLLAKVFLYLL